MEGREGELVDWCVTACVVNWRTAHLIFPSTTLHCTLEVQGNARINKSRGLLSGLCLSLSHIISLYISVNNKTGGGTYLGLLLTYLPLHPSSPESQSTGHWALGIRHWPIYCRPLPRSLPSFLISDFQILHSRSSAALHSSLPFLLRYNYPSSPAFPISHPRCFYIYIYILIASCFSRGPSKPYKKQQQP